MIVQRGQNRGGRVLAGLAVCLASSSAFAQADGAASEPQTLLSDRFDSGTEAGQPPNGWRVDVPEGTTLAIVGKDLVEPDTPPYCVRFTDNSPQKRPEMLRELSRPVAAGIATVRVRVPRHDAAPLSVQLRSQKGQLLTAVMLLPSGKMGYTIGDGNVTTSVDWPEGEWVTVRLDWDETGHFNAFLDKTPIVEKIAFATNLAPARVMLTVGYGAGQGAEGYIDGVDVVAAPPLGQAMPQLEGLEHGTWLGHGFCRGADFASKMETTAQWLINEHNVSRLYLNIGLVDEQGLLPYKSAADYSSLAAFMGDIQEAEASTGRRFHVAAWINANLLETNLADAQVRRNIVDECMRFMSTQVQNSFVEGVPRPFDGIHLDMEPSGLDEERFGYIMEIIREIRQRLDANGMTDKFTSIAAHKIGDNSNWYWSAQLYYDMAQVVDEIAVMSYNSGSLDGPAYEDWIAKQTRDSLRAVSGAHWSDAQHPRTDRPVRVLIGLPAYSRRSPHHRPEVENIPHAVIGVRRAVAELAASDPQSLSLLAGTAVFLHADDDGKFGYASTATDWPDFRRFLLGKP